MTEKEWLHAGKKVLRRLKEAGFEAYFVGGCVRDLLLGRKITDIDMTTSALTSEMKRIFKKVIPFGQKHGTIVVREAGFSFELTTYRGEKRRLSEDLRLRDFTMNALAMDEQLNLVDPHNFYKDLKRQIIRLCPPASDTLNADPLRMLRAVRFYSQLPFEVEKETLHAIEKQAHLLAKMPIERVAIEIEKLWGGGWRKEALNLFLELGFSSPHSFLQKETIEALLKIIDVARPSSEELWMLISIVQPELSTKKLPIKRELKQSLHRVQKLYKRRESEGWSDLLLYDASLQDAKQMERYFEWLHPKDKTISEKELEKRYRRLPIYSRDELAISGVDMMRHLQKQPGSWIETILRDIEREIIEGNLENRRERLLEFVESEWRKDEGKAT